MTHNDKVYERELGPNTAQVNVAYEQLRSLFVDAITHGRLYERLPFGDKSLEAHEVFAAEVGTSEWCSIINILAAIRTGPHSVALEMWSKDLIEKLAADYADCNAHDYAARSL
jgi:hypothetical protein